MNTQNTQETILIVDDDRIILTIIDSFLKAGGFTVYQANNGLEALKIVENHKPDLIISDLYMPFMSGLQLLEKFNKESPDTPIIVISGTTDINNAISALRLGAWDYIVKPFTQPVLLQTVNRVLERMRLIAENKKIRLELEEKNLQVAQGYEQLKADQKAAESVQNQLLPSPHALFDKYDISYKVIPSLYLSGDFVDYFEITEGKIGFYIADVSGHGASSAFVTILLKGLVGKMLDEHQLRNDDTILHPDKVLKQLSDEILNAKLGKYLTMIYCILDLKNNTIHYSVGGHYPNPILWDGKKSFFLKGGGFAVGIYKNATYQSYKLDLPEQFLMIMLSDGILEMMKGENLEENERILLSIFSNSQVTINKVLTQLGINSERGFPDDITFLLLNKQHAENATEKGKSARH